MSSSNLLQAFISVLKETQHDSPECNNKKISQDEKSESEKDNSTSNEIPNKASKYTDILQKQNQIKNLLNAFKSHLLSITSTEKQTIYCKLYSSSLDSQISYLTIKKIVSKRIRDKNTRWNMKLKSVLKSKGISSVFNHFLKFESYNWIESSKIKDKTQVQQLVKYLELLDAEGEIDWIKTYKK